MTKIVLYGTWPEISTGYGKIMYYMIDILSSAGYHVFVYGIQKSEKIPVRSCSWPNVVLHEVKRSVQDTNAFGMDRFCKFVESVTPSAVIIYNSPYVLSHALFQIRDIDCRKVAYLDLVYGNPPSDYLTEISKLSTDVAVFTKDMADQVEDILVNKGIPRSRPYVIRHGCCLNRIVDTSCRISARKRLSRVLFKGLPEDAFVVLNLNRNIPRKRLDTFVCAAAAVLDNIRNRTTLVSHRPIIFLMNSQHEACHNIVDIFQHECRHYKLPVHANNHMMVLTQCQSDEVIEMLMEAADIGVTCSDGEGWGLCSHEHAAIGVPQIVSPVGIFPEMFAAGGARFLLPLTYTYDGIKEGGKQLICCPGQLASEVLALYDMSAPELKRLSEQAHESASKYDMSMMRKDLLALGLN